MKPHLNGILKYNSKVYWCASSFNRGKTYFSFVLLDFRTKDIALIENSTLLAEVVIFEHDELKFIMRETGAEITKTWTTKLTSKQYQQIVINELNYALQK